MATTTEIVTKALKRIRVLGAGETPSGADLKDGSEALFAMIASWEGVSLSGDMLPLDKRFEQAIIAMLAVRLSEDYGKSVGPVLARDAKDGWETLQAAFFAVPQSSFDRALKWTGNYTDYGFFLGNEIDAASLWTASTEYALRDTVSNQGNIYECTTAGQSASANGPTGTGDNITDGTAVWVWRRVDGARRVGLIMSN